MARAYFPLPAADVRRVLTDACEIAERPGMLGCRGCAPKFVASEAPPEAFAEMTSLIEGSFTGPDRVEALVRFAACGPGSDESTTKLLRRESGGFRFVEDFPELATRRCSASRKMNGYARLACVQELVTSEPLGTAQGREVSLDVIDLHRREVQHVVSVLDTLRSSCEDGRLSELRAFGIGYFDFRDLDGDADDDLWLMALSMTTPEPPRYEAECRRYFEPADDEPVTGMPHPLVCELDKYQCGDLEFFHEGGQWRASADTEKRLAELGARKSTTSVLP